MNNSGYNGYNDDNCYNMFSSIKMPVDYIIRINKYNNSAICDGGYHSIISEPYFSVKMYGNYQLIIK